MSALRSGRSRGQTLVEFALVLPWLLMVLFGIIVLGIGVFYQQQVTNAAREAARYAAIHSATARCPTVSTWDPATPPRTYVRCDRPQDGWPFMTQAGRSHIFGMDPDAVLITACWSGYVTDGSAGPPDGIDAPPPGDYVIVPSAPPVHVDSTYMPCQINATNAAADAGSIPCTAGLARTDTASAASEGQGTIVANQVTVFACTVWSPPLAGFLLIPESVTLRAVVTEPIERQQ